MQEQISQLNYFSLVTCIYCYLLITTLCSSIHLAKVTVAVTVETSFAGVDLDQPAIVWVGLALFTEKLPTHDIPIAQMFADMSVLGHNITT